MVKSETVVLKSFASDNTAGAHPTVLQAVVAANAHHAKAYGGDEITVLATERIKAHFDDHSHVFFAFNGTGANVIALQAMTRSFEAIICAETAHINVDECGAPEKFTGCKLLTIPTDDGKLTPEMISRHLHGFGVEHHSQPKVITITQSSEYGTVYTVKEVLAITALARQHGLYVFMDGARLANAAAHLNAPLRAFTTDAGVDAVSFGGTKNGLMFGEAVVFCNPDTAPILAKSTVFIRKQSMQLASKMRFITAQFNALLTNELWLQNARHANGMAQLLASLIENVPNVRLTQIVQANAVFATLPKSVIEHLQQEYYFYVWNELPNETVSEVRLMASFDTTEAEIRLFAEAITVAIALATGSE
jgi:threonine aldolase